MSHVTTHRTNAPGSTPEERKSNLARGHIVRGVVLDDNGAEAWSGDWSFDPDEMSKADFLAMVQRETDAHRRRLENEPSGEPDAEIAVS